MVNDEWQSGPFSLVLPLSLEVGLPSPPSHAALHNRSLSPYTVVLPPPPTADRRHRASAWQTHTHARQRRASIHRVAYVLFFSLYDQECTIRCLIIDEVVC